LVGVAGGVVGGFLQLALEVVSLVTHVVELLLGHRVRGRARTHGAFQLVLDREGDRREAENEDEKFREPHFAILAR
jgi:hypothetical protein